MSESREGVFPGDDTYNDEDFYPACAIIIEGDPTADLCEDNIINGCIIEQFGGIYDETGLNWGIGIVVKRGTRNRVFSNFVNKVKMGILVEQGPFNIIKNNIITDMQYAEYMTQNPQLSNTGILVRERKVGETTYPNVGTIISGNLIEGAYNSGVYMSGTAHSIMTGNIINDCAKDGINGEGLRLAYKNAQHNTVMGNIFSDCHANGIQLGGKVWEDGATSQDTVVGNVCIRNVGAGITLNNILNPTHEEEKIRDTIVVANVCTQNISGNNIYLPSAQVQNILAADNIGEIVQE